MKTVSKIALILCLSAVLPASAKVTIGPISLGLEVSNAAETMKQIDQFNTIMEYKNSVCEKLGAQICDALINQITECTQGALSSINPNSIVKNGFDKDQVIKAAQGCAKDLWISDCLDSTLGALDDIRKKADNLSKQPARMENIVERQLVNPLTGETVKAKIDLTEKVENSLTEGYNLISGNGAKTKLGASALSALRNATSETSDMKMVAACSQDALAATEWVPLVSALNPMDLAPSVPSTIADVLTSTKEGGQDLLSKAASTVTDVASYVEGTAVYEVGKAGYETAIDGASLYLEGDKAFNNLERNAEKGNISGTLNSLESLAGVGGKAYDRLGGTTYIDPYLEQAGNAVQPYVDGAKNMASDAWNDISESAVGQAVGSGVNAASEGIGAATGAVQGGLDTAYSGVTAAGGAVSDTVNNATGATAQFMDDKMALLQDKITGLMKAGVDTTIQMVRKNQNDIQVNSNSNGIGSAQKASALVTYENLKDLENLSDNASSADDIMNLLKQIALVKVQALQRNTVITSLKAQIAEQDAVDAEIVGGVLKQDEMGG